MTRPIEIGDPVMLCDGESLQVRPADKCEHDRIECGEMQPFGWATRGPVPNDDGRPVLAMRPTIHIGQAASLKVEIAAVEVEQ